MRAPHPFWGHAATFVTIGLVCIAYALFKGTYTLSALVLAGIYTTSVLGLVTLIGLSGQFSLGHASFFGIAAYAMAVLSMNGIPSALALLLAVAVSTAASVVLAIPLVRLRGYYLAVATLAFGFIVFSLMNGWRAITLGPSGITNIPPFSLGSVVLKGENVNYWLAWSVAAFAIWACRNLWRSRVGQALLAVKSDEAAAAAMGIDVAHQKITVFAFSAMLTAIGGALYAQYVGFISPERFGMTSSFELVLAAILGGTVTPLGAVFGALLLVALPELVAPLRDFKVMFYGVIFILVSLYMPRGIAGLLADAAAILSARRRLLGSYLWRGASAQEQDEIGRP
jgi:branched-chain amino acid transport system permease protein